MKIKYAVFDFDGTLFDTMFIWDTIAEVYLHSLGKEPDPSLRNDVRSLSMLQAARYLKQEYVLSLSVEEIIAGVNRILIQFYQDEAQPKPGVVKFLQELKRAGVSMCIASATDRHLIEAALKRCRMNTFFKTIFTCSEVGHGKDEPAIYRKALEHFHADRSNTIIFEDALHAAQTAKTDGFAVAAVYDKSETQQTKLQQLCDCFLKDFNHTEAFKKFADHPQRRKQ